MHWPFYYISRTPFTCCHVARDNLAASQGATEIRTDSFLRKESRTYTSHSAAVIGGKPQAYGVKEIKYYKFLSVNFND